MEGLLDRALERELLHAQGGSGAEGVIAADLSIYNRYWTKLSSKQGVDAESLPTDDIRRFLTTKVAHSATVDRVLSYLQVEETSTKEQFIKATHILYSAVRSAQESVFTNDELWADAPPASSSTGKDERVRGTVHREWVIGAVAAARGITPEPESPPYSKGADHTYQTPSGVSGKSSSGAAESIGDDLDDTAATAFNWRSFDESFEHVPSCQPVETSQRRPAWSLLRWACNPISLDGATARLTTIPGTSMPPMRPEERARCETVFSAQGYEGGGGLQEDDARVMFERANLSSDIFTRLWDLSRIGDHEALDKRQFCLFMHLLRAAISRTALPESLSALQIAQLLGDVPFADYKAQEGSEIRLDTARVRAALDAKSRPEEEDADTPGGSRAGNENHAYRETTALTLLTLESDDEDDSFVDATENLPNDVSNLPWHGLTISGQSGSRVPTSPATYSSGSTIPRLAVPLNLSSTLSRLDRAAWEAEVGAGHRTLEIFIRAAALLERKVLDRPFVSLTVRDQLGRLVELPQESHPGHFHNDIKCIDFGGQRLELTTPLRSLPPGCLLFLEIKQWKAAKRRFSTVAWTFVDIEMMVDGGHVCHRVRCGPMVLPLFQKPMDCSLQNLKRLNGRGPGLHIAVRGME